MKTKDQQREASRRCMARIRAERNAGVHVRRYEPRELSREYCDCGKRATRHYANDPVCEKCWTLGKQLQDFHPRVRPAENEPMTHSSSDQALRMRRSKPLYDPFRVLCDMETVRT